MVREGKKLAEDRQAELRLPPPQPAAPLEGVPSRIDATAPIMRRHRRTPDPIEIASAARYIRNQPWPASLNVCCQVRKAVELCRRSW